MTSHGACVFPRKAERRWNEVKRSVDKVALLIRAKTNEKVSEKLEHLPTLNTNIPFRYTSIDKCIRFGVKVHVSAWIFFAVFLAKKEPDRLL